PAREKASAVARPMPRPAPVTRTTLSFRSIWASEAMDLTFPLLPSRSMPAVPAAPRFDPARRRAVTFALILVTALASFEATVVSTAMPTIIGDLNGLTLYSWVFSIYLLTSTVTMPLYGRLADIHGRRRILLLAIAL